MVISTNTSQLFRTFDFDYAESMKAAAEAGFDALDLTLCQDIHREEFSPENLEATCKMLVEEAKKNGIYFNQAHAPFPGIKEGNDEYNARLDEEVKRSIKIAGLIGAEQIIVHPIEYSDKETQMQKNIDYYNYLAPYAKEAGVKIALENMWGLAKGVIIPNVCSFGRDLAKYYDKLDNPEVFTVCLDLGHCPLVGQKTEDAVREVGARLGALHVHDTDSVDDLHTIPYFSKIDWEAVTDALAEVDYNGDFTFEVGFREQMRENKEIMKAAFHLLAVTGKTLAGKIENKKMR